MVLSASQKIKTRLGSKEEVRYRHRKKDSCTIGGVAAQPTVCGQKKLGGILLGQPSDLVDLLLDLQTLQVVELGFVALEGAVHVVLPAALGLVLTLRTTVT